MTIVRFLSSDVNNLIVQEVLPSGGSEQHKAMILASVAPSTFGGVGGRERGFLTRAGLSPLLRNLWRTRLTVFLCTFKASAISSSLQILVVVTASSHLFENSSV